MAVTPEGRLSLPLHYLRNTLAASSTFQSLVGAVSAAAALEFIYYGSATDESEPPPRCIVRHLAGEMAERVSNTSWSGSGPLMLLFTLENPTDEQAEGYGEKYLYVSNQLGSIIDEMLELARNPGAGPYLDLTNVSLELIGQWDPDSENGRDYWEGEFVVNWKGM